VNTRANTAEAPVRETPPHDAPPNGDAEPQPTKKRSWWSAPLRWLQKAAATVLRPLRSLFATTVLRPLRSLLSSPVRLAKTIFMATIGKDRGFGFWWLVATIAIALAIGLLIAVVLSPVVGLLAAIIVGIWMLVRRSHSSGSDEDDSDSASAPGADTAVAH
jgi:hypothetical protein